MKHVLSLDPKDLERFLDRRRANPPQFPLEMDLAENLAEALRKANEFVPSEAGSILLDDPRRKHPDRSRNSLTFLAAFGEHAEALVGQTLEANRGIAGHVYLNGRAYFTSDVHEDHHFDATIDRVTAHLTRSLVATPIRIGAEVCGVLELVNRLGAAGYSAADRDLLDIFAGYISKAIQNVLDGRLAQEYAKRDNLTGLFNDRFLHSALDHAIEERQRSDRDLAILFLDLDFFKRINDTHGHLAGSQVLREVGHLLRQELEARAAILARYGGDEFVIAIPGSDGEQGRAIAEEIRAAIRARIFCSHPGDICAEVLRLTGITCSVGVASLLSGTRRERLPAELKGQLLKEADAAMYRAKEEGRDRVRTARAGEIAARHRVDPSETRLIGFSGRGDAPRTHLHPISRSAKERRVRTQRGSHDDLRLHLDPRRGARRAHDADAPHPRRRLSPRPGPVAQPRRLVLRRGARSRSARPLRPLLDLPDRLQPPEADDRRVRAAHPAGGARQARQLRHLHDAVRRVRRGLRAHPAGDVPAASVLHRRRLGGGRERAQDRLRLEGAQEPRRRPRRARARRSSTSARPSTAAAATRCR